MNYLLFNAAKTKKMVVNFRKKRTTTRIINIMGQDVELVDTCFLDSFDVVVERRTLNKLVSIWDIVLHPLHDLLIKQRSTFSNRLIHQGTVQEVFFTHSNHPVQQLITVPGHYCALEHFPRISSSDIFAFFCPWWHSIYCIAVNSLYNFPIQLIVDAQLIISSCISVVTACIVTYNYLEDCCLRLNLLTFYYYL